MNPINILIVDDAPEYLQSAGTILKELGCPIRVSLGGEDALRLMKQQVPTVVLLDVSMKGMDGFQVCRKIRTTPDWENVAVIFVTASSDESSIQEGFLAGGQDYVTKPFLTLELLSRVRNQIRIATQAAGLKEAYQELDCFCHNVSHDLKSPLLVVRQLSSMLAEACPTEENEDVRTISGLLDEKCSHLLEMTERLLEYSRMTRLDSHMKSVNLTEIFRNISQELTSLEPERKFNITVEEIPPISADPTLMKLLVQNVISNAIKFTRHRETAEITVSCLSDTRGTTVQIQGNGAGFDSAGSDKLFQIFTRLHSSEEFEGTGVGLTIVERIMRTHNGTVKISGAKEKGALVTLWFPVL